MQHKMRRGGGSNLMGKGPVEVKAFISTQVEATCEFIKNQDQLSNKVKSGVSPAYKPALCG